MTRRTPRPALVTTATAVALLVASRDASAHGDVDVDRPTVEAHGQVRVEAGAPEHAEGGGEEREDRFHIGLDMVFGWGNVPFALQNLPTTGQENLTYTRQDQTPSSVQSFLLGGAAEVVEHVEVLFRLPLTFATFSPAGSAGRSTTSFGNLELEGEYAVPLGPHLKLLAALGVALPTAQGTEVPEGLANQPASAASQTAYDRWSLSRAASFARGYEDNALFEPSRLGLVPKLALEYRVGGLSIEPYVKVENLIGTSTTLEANYVGEFVGALRVGYHVHKHVELAVKGWVNVGFAGTADDKVNAGAVEPQVVLPFAHVRPYAGVILPVAGPPNENAYYGVRLGLGGSF
jgi:hypothetical protein